MKTSLGPRTLVYPTPVFIVGTYDDEDKPNVMAVAWGGICCSKPPCVSIAVRKATYTYGNLVARKAFTVSIPSCEHVAAADYFGMASGRDEDKFAVTGLTPVRSEVVDAPYVDEFPLALECSIVHVAELGLHTLFVGEIKDVKAEESGLDGQRQAVGGEDAPLLLDPRRQPLLLFGRGPGTGVLRGQDLPE